LEKPSQDGPAYYFYIDTSGSLLIAGGEYIKQKNFII